VCGLNEPQKKPYLSYTITIESSKLNIPKLSEKQMSLFKKICELKDEGMNFQQISDELNRLGYAPTRGKVGEFNNRKVWSNYMKIKRNLDRKDIIHPPDLDDVELEWD
tara:strand:+ start:5931 stop:6254 length:324 start_codon:yes stop_codon:yes gene_type:complete